MDQFPNLITKDNFSEYSFLGRSAWMRWALSSMDLHKDRFGHLVLSPLSPDKFEWSDETDCLLKRKYPGPFDCKETAILWLVLQRLTLR